MHSTHPELLLGSPFRNDLRGVRPHIHSYLLPDDPLPLPLRPRTVDISLLFRRHWLSAPRPKWHQSRPDLLLLQLKRDYGPAEVFGRQRRVERG